ncbi:2583_t:CDS:2, partial [Gigaspora margarita]
EIISNELSKIIEDWDLSLKVFVVATDNGINIIKATNLLILEDLKQYKPFYCRIKSLQAFFRSLKQGQRLYAMQQKNFQQGYQLPENEHMNQLDILTDIKTKWTSKKEGKKLERLYLKVEKTFNTYLDLIYGSESVNNNENETNSNSDYELLLDNINTVENLPSVNTTSTLQKVRAAIFLSLDELWSVLSNILLITPFLDPRFKDFEWCNGKEKAEAELIV